MTTNSIANACATTASPATVTVSQIASPIHIAARNGSTSRTPPVSTRATSAAMLGPGEPAATIKASANPINAATVMVASCPPALYLRRGPTIQRQMQGALLAPPPRARAHAGD